MSDRGRGASALRPGCRWQFTTITTTTFAGPAVARHLRLVAGRAATGYGEAIGTTRHQLGWEYVVLDNGALRDGFAAAPVTVVKGRVRDARPDSNGVIADLGDAQRRAAILLDATGAMRSVLGTTRRRPSAEQTAVGVLVDADAARNLVTSGSALFMDWRPHHGEPG